MTMASTKGALPKVDLTGVRRQYGSWEVIAITTLDQHYYHGKTRDGARTHGRRSDLLAIVTNDHVEGVINRLRSMYAIADEKKATHKAEIYRIDRELADDVMTMLKEVCFE
jgi:hypothetical protein